MVVVERAVDIVVDIAMEIAVDKVVDIAMKIAVDIVVEIAVDIAVEVAVDIAVEMVRVFLQGSCTTESNNGLNILLTCSISTFHELVDL